MLSPKSIIAWLAAKVNGMRLSRLKTLACLVFAATLRRGAGVLALGRAMLSSSAEPKHCIKRVWRFLRNEAVEREPALEALLREGLPRRGPLVILMDWTEMGPHRTLLLALARDGRALPFWSRSVNAAGKGLMIGAEEAALDFLRRHLPPGRRAILVADRGFGCARWMRSLEALGWGYVLRLRRQVMVCDGEGDYCKLRELGVRPGDSFLHWGKVTLSDHSPTPTLLVSVWREDAKEPWFLATNLEGRGAESVAALYSRRMWIELAIRDCKSRKWGMGIGEVRLSSAGRLDRLFLVVLVAYFFLSAYGAAAEATGIAGRLKANTVTPRVLSLASIGFLLLHKLNVPLRQATRYLPWECAI